jgi:hypothetical protein
MGQGVPDGVNPAALPSGVDHLADGRLDSLLRIGDDQFDAAQGAACQLAEELRPDRAQPRRFRPPCPAPRTSRRSFELTPTAMMTATETMRPPRRTFRWGASIQMWARRPRSAVGGRPSLCRRCPHIAG